MRVFMVVFTWIFTFFIVFSHLSLSSYVHGQIFPPGYLLGNIAINCGCVSNSTALDGRQWVGETPLLRPIGNSRSSTSAHKSLSGADPTPYLTARISFFYFSYHFQVNPGQKFIRLHFYPDSYQGFENSQDFFNVEANSFTLLQNFSASLAVDVLGDKYVVKEYCLNVNETGILQIKFFPSQTNIKISNTHAFVNGIEIISMPTGLYYTPENNLGPLNVGQRNHFHYVENSTALELVQRLNVGGGFISPVEDRGMFRRWTEDVDYLLDSGFKQIDHLESTIEYTVSPPFVAPPKIYQTSRKLRQNLQIEDHFTWKIPVDVGFSYLLRLHFSFFGIEFLEGGTEEFNILIQNHVAEAQINVIQLSGGKRTPVYRDYLVMVRGHRAQGKRDLCISLQSFEELVLGLLNGLEIYKLSNPEDSLASPNPSCPRHLSSSWTLKIHKVLVTFGQSNVIATALTIIFALVNSSVYHIRRVYGYTFRLERNMDSALDEPTFRHFSLTEILLATHDFNESLVIGKGGFGKVYKGFIHGHPEILAIKRLKPDSNQGAREFWREIETLSKLRHVHLVSLLGYCMEKEEMILVYEYIPKGTLADSLYKSGRDGKETIPLTWEQRVRICIGAARGLDYLHTGTQHGIIHRDVKDTNILLDENLVAKISDFGLSKLGKIGETHGEHSTRVKGTIGYLDPDYIMTNKPSTKSDVYAFGIVLLVVLSGRPALERRFFEETKCLLDCYRECVTKGETNEIIDPFLQGEILAESLTSFMEVVGNCLHRRPKKRPTMAQLVVQLEHALEKQLGSVPSMYGDDTVVGQNSRTRSNRPFEFYEFQFAPSDKESIISLPREGNNANREIQKGETRVDKGKDHKITQKPLWGRPLASLRNILKPSKKTYPGLLPTNVFGEWKHQIPMFSLKDIKLATEDFSVKNIIGRGGYGTMYKGFINDGAEIVAIKRFGSSAFKGDKQFQTEVELLSTIHHIHLVRLVGLCYERIDLIVVYEYMSHGTLKDHLYGNLNSRNGQTCLTWEQRLKICIGAALGLTYLHEAGFIHRDVKVENIMLHEENFVAKISDFGLSKRISLAEESETHVSTRVVGTLGYMDPSYALAGRLTKKSDVYSFGIVLLVVLSGTPAFDSSRPEKNQLVKDWYETCSREGNFDGLIDPKLVGGIPLGSLGSFLELIKICLNEQPKRRPVMAQVVVNLERSLDLLDKEKEAQSADTSSKTAEQIKRRVEIARLWELDMLKGDVESEMKPKGRDIDTMHHNYTV